jgi:hypothetical protein
MTGLVSRGFVFDSLEMAPKPISTSLADVVYHKKLLPSF